MLHRTVLLTGGRAPVALDVARHLARAGCRVVAAESMAWPLTRSSRSVARSVRVPPPRQQPAAFLDAIAGLAEEERAALVVPTCEETFTVARLAARGVPVFTSPPDVLARLHDKGRFAKRMDGLGLPVPETHRITSRAHLAPFLTDDWVLKPAFSRFGVEALVPPHCGRRIMALCPTPERPIVAQRCATGQQLCTTSVCHGGRVVAHAAYRTPFVAGHAGVWFRHSDHAGARHIAERLAAAERFTGFLSLDFIEREDGSVVAIECNPRATSGLHLFHAARLAAAILDADPTKPAGGDAHLALPMLAAGAACRVSADWRRAAQSSRDVVWDARDPLPAASQMLTAATFLLRAARFRCSPLAAATRDIEWNGDA